MVPYDKARYGGILKLTLIRTAENGKIIENSDDWINLTKYAYNKKWVENTADYREAEFGGNKYFAAQSGGVDVTPYWNYGFKVGNDVWLFYPEESGLEECTGFEDFMASVEITPTS